MWEKDFFDSETILIAHIYDVGPKIKIAESIWCDLSKLVREGQKANEKKIQLNRAHQFREEAHKLPKNAVFQNMIFSDSFGAFSREGIL